MKSFLAIFPIIFLAACGTVEHSVKVEDQQAFGTDTKILVGEVSNKTGETFNIDIEAMLRDAIENELAKDNLLGTQDSPDVVKMNLNIIEYREGDAFKRWLWPGYGSTVLVIEATLLDRDGNVDATAQANRSVDAGGGFTIGAWEKIFKTVASDLVSDLKGSISGATTGSP
ncbi:MAG: DUF4410 domain-containing protein [Thiogranum sp.]